jgi:tetratricopeptide (TPR) repeat protein
LATSLNSLAELYHFQGQYAQAEPLFKRALAINEKALGPGHPNLATTLDNLADLYTKTGRKDEANRLFDRAARIRAKQ